MSADLIGIIPAAGLGTRMAAFSAELPKALIEVEGRALIENAIESLISIGVSRIIVVIGHRGEQVHDYFSTRQFPVQIEFAAQEQQLGLAHAIASASDLITGDFVVLCPDNRYSEVADLRQAARAFLTRSPPFLMVATVTPTHQRDRAKYFSAVMRKVSPHVYEYRYGDDVPARGLALNSTGCTFFSHKALSALPSFDTNKESSFHDYLTQLETLGQPLVYLLRGMRYDFSGPDDIEEYRALQERLREANGAGVSAILVNREGKVLLQHRDDNPAIRYPGHWALFGGSIEPGESPHAAARREIFEETGYNIDNLGLFRQFVQNGKREFAYAGEIDASLDELSLTEGQGMDYVRPEDLPGLLLRPDDKETLKAYFGAWDE
jgi:NDP-sugar pyrophosphorylase family protein